MRGQEAGIDIDPGAGEEAEEMAVGEEEDGAIGGETGLDDVPGAGGDLVDRLALRGTVFPKAPARAFGDEIGGEAAFESAVVPLGEIGMDLSDVAEAGEAAGVVGAYERAGPDLGKVLPGEEAAEGAGLLFAVEGEG